MKSKVTNNKYQSLLIGLNAPLNISLQVEKCARFHIVCSERLVEVDSHDFDKKLNDENLTKCIQTLKHMYYDLSIQGRHELSSQNYPSYDLPSECMHCKVQINTKSEALRLID